MRAKFEGTRDVLIFKLNKYIKSWGLNHHHKKRAKWLITKIDACDTLLGIKKAIAPTVDAFNNVKRNYKWKSQFGEGGRAEAKGVVENKLRHTTKGTFYRILQDYILWYEDQTKYSGSIGLKNFGSTCYFNASAQLIYACTPIREWILNFDLKKEKEFIKRIYGNKKYLEYYKSHATIDRTDTLAVVYKKLEMIDNFRIVMFRLHHKTPINRSTLQPFFDSWDEAFYPTGVVPDKGDDYNPHFASHKSADVNEFMVLLLECLMLNYRNDYFASTFYGQIKHFYKDNVSRYDKTIKDGDPQRIPYRIYQFHMDESKQTVHLSKIVKECLAGQLVIMEDNDGSTCRLCIDHFESGDENQLVPMEIVKHHSQLERILIDKDYFIFSLKRYKVTVGGKKIRIKTKITPNNIIINEIEYEPVSIIPYLPGHYCAYAVNDNGMWYKFNDSSKSFHGTSCLNIKNGYMFMYKKRSIKNEEFQPLISVYGELIKADAIECSRKYIGLIDTEEGEIFIKALEGAKTQEQVFALLNTRIATLNDKAENSVFSETFNSLKHNLSEIRNQLIR